MQEIVIIAAMAENRVIGKDNALPWPLKEGLGNFKELTMGWPCIMGRKTWESLPKRPLPGRLNIVVSRALSLEASSVPKNELCPQGVKIVSSLPAAIEHCVGYEKIFICGGEAIYKQTLELANKIELTLLHKSYDGDTFFPEIDSACWEITNTVNFDTFSFITYTKKNN
jgi:dihydrofolate reductase